MLHSSTFIIMIWKIIDGQNICFVPEFCYLGVVFQSSGITFSKHISKRVKAAFFATSKLKSLPESSVTTALKLFTLAISPIASYGIESIWSHLKMQDFFSLETVKTCYLKKALGLSKYIKSRFTYKLADTFYLVQELKNQFSLPSTAEYEKMLVNKNFTLSQIDSKIL
jgi:hypothetical protein